MKQAFKKVIAPIICVMLSMLLGLSMAACGGGGGNGGSGETPAAETEQPAATEAPAAKETTEEEKPSPTESVVETIEEDEAVVAETAIETEAQFPSAVNNNAPEIAGGVLRYGLAAESGFAGVLNPGFYTDAYDATVLGFFYESLIAYDENFVADQHGAATYTYDIEEKTLTLTVRDGVKWHDGEPVTADDLLFAFECIAHPDSESFRYDEDMQIIVGVKEYHDGQASSIEGLTLSEDKMSLTIQYIEFFPSILVGGFWTSPLPRHYMGDIPVADMPSHEKSRISPIGFGPFKLVSIVPGESAEYERFDDYWRGRPKLDGVRLEVVNPALVPTAMEEGHFDIVDFNVMLYPDYPSPTNYQYLGELQTVFNYTGFKVGKWDLEGSDGSGINVVDPTMKMYNQKLRQAVGYAVDADAIGENVYNGLRFRATTPITPRHAGYQDTSLRGYYYNPDLANRLLDEAGYADIDGDGFREDPDGNQFTIYWAAMEGMGADTIAQFKIQQWAEVGLRVELYGGRLMEFNAFYDSVEFDEEGMDMYDAAWQTGFNPSPNVLWGETSPANYTRYTNAKLIELMNEINSTEAWDQDFLTAKYKEWQKEFLEDPPAIPVLWRINLQAVNNRVKNYDNIAQDIKPDMYLWALTANEPYAK